uniref:Uncharacterized protein n=1 Tax=Hyaloperonospora arabidopsidis (strain Emoy2) TaxID=559515 RepID=M4B8E3_HYAAE
MASQGLASWLSGRLSACAGATSIASDSQPQDNKRVAGLSWGVNSPLDISFAQLCAKDTMPPMSVETPSLVEEIDSEADDAEFDERAHWSRRSLRKKARASRRGSGAAVDASQPSIARFCVKAQVVLVADTKEEEVRVVRRRRWRRRS